MTVKIMQHIEQTDTAEYVVTLAIDDAEPITDTFTRSNAVFPAYHSLTRALYDFEDCEVHVTTNSKALVSEFNAVENVNATHLRNLKQVAARQGIVLTITATE